MTEGTKPTPNIRTLAKIEELDRKIKELYEAKREVITKAVEKYGAGEFVYELEEQTEDGQKFVRYKFTDSLEEFTSGQPIFKATAVERFGFEVRYLKHRPKEK